MMESSSKESPGGVDGSIRGQRWGVWFQRDSDAGRWGNRGGVDGYKWVMWGWMMVLEEDVGGVDESRGLGGGEDNVSIGGMKVGFVDWESRVEQVDEMNDLDLCIKYEMMVSM